MDNVHQYEKREKKVGLINQAHTAPQNKSNQL
jgi:hypothetical protein